jgi:hypothetical protein
LPDIVPKAGTVRCSFDTNVGGLHCETFIGRDLPKISRP